ncbi:MAG TPA: metallopeptidase family protein [Actinomycetota bacterium]|nr:metallopeptidase family protein [Actinomycetota bacterium]
MARVSPERFEELVAEALDGLPDWVQERLDNVEVLVEERPPAGQRNLLGLYEGVPLTQRTSSGYFGVLPDRITLFRSNIERISRDEDDLRERVRHTVEHEVAHFFGISDDRLREIDRY